MELSSCSRYVKRHQDGFLTHIVPVSPHGLMANSLRISYNGFRRVNRLLENGQVCWSMSEKNTGHAFSFQNELIFSPAYVTSRGIREMGTEDEGVSIGIFVENSDARLVCKVLVAVARG